MATDIFAKTGDIKGRAAPSLRAARADGAADESNVHCGIARRRCAFRVGGIRKKGHQRAIAATSVQAMFMPPR
jgi:hypothetical protein